MLNIKTGVVLLCLSSEGVCIFWKRMHKKKAVELGERLLDAQSHSLLKISPGNAY